MPDFRQEQLDAAPEFVQAAIDALRNEQGVHAETAVAATARMAGTFLFRSFGFDLPSARPGQPVLSDRANERGPELIQILGSTLNQIGAAPWEQSQQNAGQPQQSFLETQPLLEPQYNIIKDRFGLSLTEASHAAAVAAALLIHQCSEVLDPKAAYQIAAFGFVEGSKTVPLSIPCL